MSDTNVADTAFENIKMDYMRYLFPKTTEIQIICPCSLDKNKGGTFSKVSGFSCVYLRCAVLVI